MVSHHGKDHLPAAPPSTVSRSGKIYLSDVPPLMASHAGLGRKLPSQPAKRKEVSFDDEKSILAEYDPSTPIAAASQTKTIGTHEIVPPAVSRLYDEEKASLCKIEIIDDPIKGRQYYLTHESGPDHQIHETFATKPFDQIPRVTQKLKIWKESLQLCVFLDEGASVTCCGPEIAEKLQRYFDNGVKKSITAGGFDSRRTGTFHRSDMRLKVPIEYHHFRLATGKYSKEKRVIRIWVFKAIPPNMIIAGRDTKHILNLGTFDKNEVKELVYHHRRKALPNEMPSDEYWDEALERIEYRNKGDPGIYRIGSDH